MTPERIEEIKSIIEDFGRLGSKAALELLATLEEAQQQLISKTEDLAGAQVIINGHEKSAERKQQFIVEQAEYVNGIAVQLREAQQTIKELQEGNRSACESRELAYRARNEAVITNNQHYKQLVEAQQTIAELTSELGEMTNNRDLWKSNSNY